MPLLRTFVPFFLVCVTVEAWTNIDFEVFDAVEEVNKNFYELMGVNKDATSGELKKAFRKLSLQLHPDKNPDPDADVQFRNLVTAHEVLKDEEKRKKYDEVLRDGLPDWRQPIFYFRRVRKMGMAELLVILSIIATLGQYLMAWGAYWEKKFAWSDHMTEKRRKREKRLKKKQIDSQIEEEEFFIEKPSVWNLLPFQFLRLIRFLIVSTPSCITFCLEAFKEWRERKVEEESEEDEEPTQRERRPKRRKVLNMPDFSDEGCLLDPVEAPVLDEVKKNPQDEENSQNKMEEVVGFWSDNHLAVLSKLMKKYPGGTPDRWEKIADAMFRTVDEVTAMARKIKDEGYHPGVSIAAQGLTGQEDAIVSDPMTMRENEEERTEVEVKEKTKKKTTKTVADTKAWGQKQQKALEEALKQYRKGTDGRWDKIASKVPGKSKEECISRYMMLVEKVKKKTATDNQPESSQPESNSPQEEKPSEVKSEENTKQEPSSCDATPESNQE